MHRRFSARDFIAQNEVGGIIIAVSGTLYAVILGFLTVVVWQKFVDAGQMVVLESDAVIDVWHTSVGLRRPDTRARAHRHDPLRANDDRWRVAEHEARRLRCERRDAGHGCDRSGRRVRSRQPRRIERPAFDAQELNTIHDARQQRIAINGGGVPWFEWLVLLIGATCIICFCWLFELRNSRMQLLMTSTVVIIIGSILVLLFELQYPFRSDVGIGPDAWQGAVEHIHQMQAGTMADMKK